MRVKERKSENGLKVGWKSPDVPKWRARGREGEVVGHPQTSLNGGKRIGVEGVKMGLKKGDKCDLEVTPAPPTSGVKDITWWSEKNPHCHELK